MPSRIRYAVLLGLLLVGITGLSLGLYELLRDAHFDLPSTFINVSMWMLFSFLVLLILRYIGLLWFSYLNHLERDDEEPTRLPPVTILVPAYNEGAVIQGSIRSLLALDYPRYEILVIDDGSKDDTTTKASAYAGDHGRAVVRVITKPNGGKARALNTGISQATSEFVLCMDGDSALHPQTLRRAIPIRCESSPLKAGKPSCCDWRPSSRPTSAARSCPCSKT